MRRAGAVTDEALRAVVARGLVGRAERDVAWDLQAEYHRLGADGEAFAAIVATGDHGAQAHALPGERVIRAGELVVVDTGARVDGYCSDITRTFAAGEPSEELRRVYDVVLAAQLAGLAAVRAGAHGRLDVDAAARAVIDGGRLRRALRPRHRPRRRPPGARGAVAGSHPRRPARGGHGVHRRARHLHRGAGRCAHRGHGAGDGRRSRAPHHVAQGAAGHHVDVRAPLRAGLATPPCTPTPEPARPGTLLYHGLLLVQTDPLDP